MPTRREILAREVAEKLRLEAKLKPGIRKIFARAIDDFRVSFGRTGRIPEVTRYRTSFESLLEDHYRRVQKSFSGAILLHNNEKTFAELRRKQAQLEEEESNIEELIAAIFLLWREEHAPVQSDIIAATTGRDMSEAVDQARNELAEDGKPLDNRSIAAAAVAILRRTFRNRVDLIAVTETQTAAETTKAIEASTAARVLIPGIPVPRDIVQIREPVVPMALKKSWLTLRDNKVRETHRAVEGQTMPLNEAFIVGGARLMFPGDTSLGAPIREIAHCRCSAEYKLGVA